MITVSTVPMDGMRWVECSDCGPLGMCDADDAKCWAVQHLQGHGVDTKEIAC